MSEPLNIGDFAELGRMLKYIDRHDSEEIISTMKQEGQKEMENAEKNLALADELIEQTTGETNEENIKNSNEENTEVSGTKGI